MEDEKQLAIRPTGETVEGAEKSNSESSAASAEAPAVPPPALPADLPVAYEKLQAERKELYERLLRKQAELENLRKRTQREKEEFRQHAAEELVRALLPTLDSFERALKHRDASAPESLYQGMELIYRELRDILGRAGLTPIETAGKLFDPHLHQAVETVADPERNDQEIIEELQRGYKLKHRLIRPAIVKVAVRPRAEGPSPSEQPEKTN
jgi:molecular chaperone GrpE